MVPRKQFEQYFDVDLSETNPSEVDLDAGDEEIFEDDERGIRGLRPEGRVRLRKFVSNEDGRMVTAPERRTYAPYNTKTPPNFLKGVTKWAFDSQKDIIGDPKKLADEFYKEDWVRYGGSYEDTSDGNVMAAMLEPVLSKDQLEDVERAGNMPQELEDEGEIESELEGGSTEARAQEVQDHADENLKHFGVYHEIMDDDWGGHGGPPRIYYNGNAQIELNSEFGEPREGDWDDHEDKVNEIMTDAFDNHYIYIQDADPQVYNDQWTTDVPLGHDDEPTPEGFESFVRDLINNEGNWDEILEFARDKFVDEGIIEPEITKALRQFERYDRLNVKVTPEERQIDVFTKKPIHLLKDWRAFKEFPIEEQSKIKEEFVKKFYDAGTDYLMEISDHVGLTALTDVGYGGMYLLPKQQGINVDLQGINLRFQLSFKYNDKNDKQVDAIKRFLNVLNSTSNYHKLEDIAFRAFHEAMPETYRPPSSEKDQPEETDDIESDARKLNQFFESKKAKVSDKMLFESWRRYLGK